MAVGPAIVATGGGSAVKFWLPVAVQPLASVAVTV
jgi:hypothetical protein